MPSYEENIQVLLDLRARVLDTTQDDPAPDEVWKAVEALHETRGVAVAKKQAAAPIIDLADIFKPKSEKK